MALLHLAANTEGTKLLLVDVSQSRLESSLSFRWTLRYLHSSTNSVSSPMMEVGFLLNSTFITSFNHKLDPSSDWHFFSIYIFQKASHVWEAVIFRLMPEYVCHLEIISSTLRSLICRRPHLGLYMWRVTLLERSRERPAQTAAALTNVSNGAVRNEQFHAVLKGEAMRLPDLCTRKSLERDMSYLYFLDDISPSFCLDLLLHTLLASWYVACKF